MALADGLGGGLVGAAGPGDHGGAGRFAIEAFQVLAVPHGAAAAAAGGLWVRCRDRRPSGPEPLPEPGLA